MSAEELRHVVTTEIQSFLHGRKERGEVTLRMIKEYLLGAVGQEVR